MYRSHRQEDFDAFNDHYGFEDEEYDDERPPNARDPSVKKSFIREANLPLDLLANPWPLPVFSAQGPPPEPNESGLDRDTNSSISSGPVMPEMKSETSSASASSTVKRSAQKAGIEAHREDDQPTAQYTSASSSKRPRFGNSHSVVVETSKPAIVRPQPRSKSDSRLVKPKKLTPAQLAKEKLAETAKLSQSEYIKYVNMNGPVRGGKPSVALKGMAILYLTLANAKGFATEETRGKIDFIVKNGGKVSPEFSDEVTHVVSDLDEKLTSRRLGFKSINDVSKNLPILDYKWITKVVNTGIKSDLTANDKFYSRLISRNVVRQQSETVGPSRPSTPHRRSNAGFDSDDSHHRPDSEEEELSDKGEDTSDPRGLRERAKKSSSSSPLPRDDLEHWVALAKEYEDLGDMLENDSEAEMDPKPDHAAEHAHSEEPSEVTPANSKYACDDKNGSKINLNADITDQLSRLVKIYEATGDRWQAMQTTRAIASIRRHSIRLKSGKEALKLRYVGERMAEKIDDVIKTGYMRRLQYQESTESSIITKLFMGIYGVGMTTARDWFNHGMRTLDDLKKARRGVILTPAQRIGLKYYDDLAERMPRSEAKAIFESIEAVAKMIDSSLELTIMGSFRRGQETCGDIDVLLTRPTKDGRTHSGILRKLLPKLHAAGILTEDLSYPSNQDDEEAKYMGLCRLGREGKMRRIDILTIPYCQRGAALIYFTGDDIFNRSLRLKARHDGYSLNQRGLFAGVCRDPKTNAKLSEGTLIASETEREIFEILKVPWQEPHQRRRAS